MPNCWNPLKKRAAALATAVLTAIFLIPMGVFAEEGGYVYPAPPDLFSEAAVLIEAETGQVLYGRNETKRMEPASLTKIMTCLLGVELWDGGEDDTATVTAEALFDIDAESSSIDLVTDESIALPDLFYALMLPSANDAANVIAQHLAGSIEDFVEMMNTRTRELKLTGTHFSNPHGLPADNHYSTAYDIAQITREAVKNKSFMRFAGAAAHTIPASAQEKERELEHTNRMLVPDHEMYYPSAVAGKTGWTRRAGHCLMTVAERDGLTLICVVMRAGSTANEYEDTEALLEYGFENFKKSNIDCTPYDNTEIKFTDSSGQARKAILSLRERKFPAIVPKDAQGDMMVFSLPNAESITDGNYGEALLSWSEAVTGAPQQPIRKVQVRVWVENIQPANAAAAAAVEVEEGPEEKSPSSTWLVLGGAVLAGGAFLARRRSRR